jgi:hypothetical protein
LLWGMRAGLFHSKQGFKLLKAEASTTLRLSHVVETMVAIQVEGEIAGESEKVRQGLYPNAGGIFTLGHITDIMHFVFDVPVIPNPFGKLLNRLIQ